MSCADYADDITYEIEMVRRNFGIMFSFLHDSAIIFRLFRPLLTRFLPHAPCAMTDYY